MTPPQPAPEPVPPAAASLFGANLDRARQYADLLVTDGIEHGLVGPREGSRIWTRHLLNCVVVADLIPNGVRVVDVGSGAGLPGLALALRRPDLQVQLVEPLQRRTVFLEDAVERLALTDRVQVVRGRAEDPAVRKRCGGAECVTARAVAPLDRLAGWCLPLLAPDGVLLALKGGTAADELHDHRAALIRAGAARAEVAHCGQGQLDPPTAVIRVVRGPAHRRGRP